MQIPCCSPVQAGSRGVALPARIPAHPAAPSLEPSRAGQHRAGQHRALARAQPHSALAARRALLRSRRQVQLCRASPRGSPGGEPGAATTSSGGDGSGADSGSTNGSSGSSGSTSEGDAGPDAAGKGQQQQQQQAQRRRSSSTAVLAGSAGSYALMAAAAFALAELCGVGLAPQYAPAAWLAGAPPSLAFLAVFLAALVAAVRYQDRVPALQEIDRVLKQGMVPMLVALPPWGVALLAFSAGVGEEALFRGFLQAALSSRAGAALAALPSAGLLSAPGGGGELLTAAAAAAAAASAWAGPAIGLALASVVFGALHAVTPLYFWWATAAGALFGLEYLYWGLPAASMTHFLYDWAALALSVDEAKGGRVDGALKRLLGVPPPPAP